MVGVVLVEGEELLEESLEDALDELLESFELLALDEDEPDPSLELLVEPDVLFEAPL